MKTQSFFVNLLIVGTWISVSRALDGAEQPESSDEPSTLKAGKKVIAELREQLSKYKTEIERLQRKKKAITSDATKLQDNLKRLQDKLIQCEANEKEAMSSESYIRQEMGNFALEVSQMRMERRKMEVDLAECRQKVDDLDSASGGDNSRSSSSSSSCAKAAETGEDLARRVEGLEDKIQNCEETVKAVRDRCDKDQAALKQLTKDQETLAKTSGNCTDKLKECETQKGYLEFLKKGYDVVVQDLEKEAKVAKEDKERSDKHAADAVKGASTYRTFLVAIGISATIYVTVKFYQYASDTIRRRTLEAKKDREKLDSKKNKRK